MTATIVLSILIAIVIAFNVLLKKNKFTYGLPVLIGVNIAFIPVMYAISYGCVWLVWTIMGDNSPAFWSNSVLAVTFCLITVMTAADVAKQLRDAKS